MAEAIASIEVIRINSAADLGLRTPCRLEACVPSAARYESALDDEHHDHLICVECGRITEFCDEAIETRQEEIAKQHGFRIVDHKMELYGVCLEGCASRHANS